MDVDHKCSVEELEQSGEEIIPDESIIQRLNLHKDRKLYQLGKHSSWTSNLVLEELPLTVAIPCFRTSELVPEKCLSSQDELQFRGIDPNELEQSNADVLFPFSYRKQTLSCLSRRNSHT